MASTTATLALYSTAGALELAGVAMTTLDLRSKNRAAKRFRDKPMSADMKTKMAESFAASHGIASYGELERSNAAIVAALRGPWLPLAAALLALGVIVGTIANAVSATRP